MTKLSFISFIVSGLADAFPGLGRFFKDPERQAVPDPGKHGFQSADLMEAAARFENDQAPNGADAARLCDAPEEVDVFARREPFVESVRLPEGFRLHHLELSRR